MKKSSRNYRQRLLLATGALPSLKNHLVQLQTAGFQIIHIENPKNFEEIRAYFPDVTHYILGGPEYIGHRELSKLSKLEHLVLLGTGIPSFVNEEAIRNTGIRLSNTPHMNCNGVAEYALSMLISSLAGTFNSYAQMRNGSAWWQKPRKELSESRIGILGLGEIGSLLARKIRLISEAKILYVSRSSKPTLEKELSLMQSDLKGLVSTCDALVMCIPFNNSTKGIINRVNLAYANPKLSILCFSNPRTVVAADIKELLKAGSLSFFYMDGYYQEWENNKGITDDPQGLLSLGPDQFYATSHIAAQTEKAIEIQLNRAIFLILDGVQ
ncbi:D-2-hydroxyisocaproate dehydrogenase [Candidatus Bartonella washoeensis]|uniref:D-isomer specific 2-hydroxyacid dehydrogenase NAD-binding domain-containing protein n=1 Tax=Candidatus Bartonella washoeensis Sb944nv TaxID=1094563 RepID=J1J2P2_9HYPH|nr:NAD(P)-dependent oxidoreductase [Bartonella washoeensis]EJF77895.1 hypothetical protein MCQ_01338 [Bartonella washoeensis Sb944nv]SPU27556.1 D-2-hydroxyisocaproate dehydrogenase [Bartonella washoeensis]